MSHSSFRTALIFDGLLTLLAIGALWMWFQ